MPRSLDLAALAVAMSKGDPRAHAPLITALEEGTPGHEEALSAVFSAAVPAHRIGVTGAPGVGKSTLTDRLVRSIRAAGHRVAGVAADPRDGGVDRIRRGSGVGCGARPPRRSW